VIARHVSRETALREGWGGSAKFLQFWLLLGWRWFGPRETTLRNELCIDAISFGSRPPTCREGLHLGRPQLSCRTTCAFKQRPQLPFLTTGGLEADQRAHQDGEIDKAAMPRWRIGQPQPFAIEQTIDVQPIMANIYPNDPCVCCFGHALFVLFRDPEWPHSTVRGDEERRCWRAKKRGQATRLRRQTPPGQKS